MFILYIHQFSNALGRRSSHGENVCRKGWCVMTTVEMNGLRGMIYTLNFGDKKKILIIIIIITWKLKLRRRVLVKNDCIVSHRCPTSSPDYVFSSPHTIMTYTTNHCEWFYSIFSVNPASVFVFLFCIYTALNTHTHLHKSRI